MNRTIKDIQTDIEQLGIKGGYDIEQLLTPQDCRRLSYEIERLNNIINDALGIANERVNYYFHINRLNHYSHINKKEILEDWENIFDVLVERNNQELKGSDSNE